MAGDNFDSNPAKYLVVYGDDPKFLKSLRELADVETSIGEANSSNSNSVMLSYLNVLLAQKEDEIQDRILLIQERDKDLQASIEQIQTLIMEIHRIYASKRYRLGHLILNPIEMTINLLRTTR
jgi:hypothetical protein